MDFLYGLVWVSGLLAALRLCAPAARVQKHRERRRIPLAEIIILLLPILPNLFLVSLCRRLAASGFEPNWLTYTASWGVVYVIVAIGLFVFLLRRPAPVARWFTWSGPACLLVLFGGLLVIDRGRIAELEALRDDALEVKARLLPPPPALADDATPLYAEVFERLEAARPPPEVREEILDVYKNPFGPWPDWTEWRLLHVVREVDTAALSAFLQPHRTALQRAREAVRRAGLRLQRDDWFFFFTGGFGAACDELRKYRRLARLLVLSAVEQARRDEWEAVFYLLLDLRSLGAQLFATRWPVAGLFAVDIWTLEAESLEALLSVAGERHVPGFYRDA
ncbi:MAG: hypothetical protein JXA90_17000, partial [Planctomycetes bacterium]|nr:hypothetical protein [Planctomycetota bacterium]